MISNYLSLHSRLRLALTCKGAFIFFYPTGIIPGLSHGDWIEWLLDIEKDNPELFLCSGCTRFHTFDPEHRLGWQGQKHNGCGRWVERRWVKSRSPNRKLPHLIAPGQVKWGYGVEYYVQKCQLNSWKPCKDGPEIDFSEAHVVMNRHFYGARHGLPITVLERSFSFERLIDLKEPDPGSDHFPLERHIPGRQYPTRSAHRRLLEGNVTKHPKSKGNPGPGDDHFLLEVDIPGRQYHTRFAHRRVVEGRITKHPKTRAKPDPALLTPWRFWHKYTAQIINDELYVIRHHKIEGPSVSLIKYKTLFQLVDLPVCRHWRLGGNASDGLPEAREFLKGGPNSGCSQSVRSCQCCYTDYEITIGHDKAEGTFSLELNTYHRLGSCRSVDDPVWLSFTDVFKNPHRSFNQQEGFRAGKVRSRVCGKRRGGDGSKPQWVKRGGWCVRPLPWGFRLEDARVTGGDHRFWTSEGLDWR